MARQPSTTRSKVLDITNGKQQDTQRDVSDIENEQGIVANDAPEPDEALDAEIAESDDSEEVEKDENEEILVRLLHPVGVQHINGHPLEGMTVTHMKRKDVANHQERGVALEEVGDDYDGEVYDVSEPWAPEAKEEV